MVLTVREEKERREQPDCLFGEVALGKTWCHYCGLTWPTGETNEVCPFWELEREFLDIDWL